MLLINGARLARGEGGGGCCIDEITLSSTCSHSGQRSTDQHAVSHPHIHDEPGGIGEFYFNNVLGRRHGGAGRPVGPDQLVTIYFSYSYLSCQNEAVL